MANGQLHAVKVSIQVTVASWHVAVVVVIAFGRQHSVTDSTLGAAGRKRRLVTTADWQQLQVVVDE